jgi:hypothetical protein
VNALKLLVRESQNLIDAAVAAIRPGAGEIGMEWTRLHSSILFG